MRLRVFLIICSFIFLAACGSDNAKGPSDTLTSGELTISADETYKPIIEAQKNMFDSSFPEAHVTINYKPEAECIQDFLDEKVRLILVARDLTASEKKYCEEKKIVASSLAVARDAVAVIVNNASQDSILALAQLKGILTGQYPKKYTVVFDNSGSSTFRFIQDSLMGGQKLGANVFAAKSNEAVVDYVAKNENAIGFVGFSYVNAGNTAEQEWTSEVRVVAIEDTSGRGFHRPYQAYVALQSYPLTRDLYYVKSENYAGLGTGFANFLATERGQLIFKTAMFFPLRSNIVIKDAAITNKPLR